DRAGRHRVLLRLDCVRNCCLPIGRDACRDRNATADSGESRSDRGRCCRRDRWRTPIQRVEGASPCLLQGAIETRAYVAGGCCHGLAARAASRPPLYLRLHWLYGDPPRHRGHGSASDGFVTAAITAERLAPNGERVARAVGIVVVGVGLLLLARAAAGLG